LDFARANYTNPANLASAYERAAGSSYFSPEEQAGFQAQAQQTYAQKQQQDLERQYRDQAYSVRDPLRQSNIAFRDTERERLLQERDAGYKSIDDVWNKDLAVIEDLFSRKQIDSSQRSAMRRQANADRTAARDNMRGAYSAGRATISDLYGQNQAFIDETVASLMQGGYDPSRAYTLPVMDASGIRLSASYTPLFGSPTLAAPESRATALARAPETGSPASKMPADTLKRLFEQSQGFRSSDMPVAQTQASRDLGRLPVSAYGQAAPDLPFINRASQAPSVFDPALRPVLQPVFDPLRGLIQGPQAGVTPQFREGGEVSASKKDLDALPKFQAGGFVPLARILPSERQYLNQRIAEYDAYNQAIDDYNAAVQDYNTELVTIPGSLWAETFYRTYKQATPFAASAAAQNAPVVSFPGTTSTAPEAAQPSTP
jgi:hypothetical protein